MNDAALHGLPHDYTLRDGDLLSLDFAVSVDGWVADSALSLVVRARRGRTISPDRHHSARPRRGYRGRGPGNRMGDISARHRRCGPRGGPTGQHPLRRARRRPHDARRPARPQRRPRGRGYPLKPGLVIAIEPWFLHTTDQIYTDADGWTLRSADGSRGAHMEHTIAITDDGPVVLTARD